MRGRRCVRPPGALVGAVQLAWAGSVFCLSPTLAAVFLLFFFKEHAYVYFLLYVVLVAVQYLPLRWWGKRSNWLAWVAFLSPIALLVLLKYVPPGAFAHFSPALRDKLRHQPKYHWGVYFIGLSYLAFRTSSLAVEVRTGARETAGVSGTTLGLRSSCRACRWDPSLATASTIKGSTRATGPKYR